MCRSSFLLNPQRDLFETCFNFSFKFFSCSLAVWKVRHAFLPDYYSISGQWYKDKKLPTMDRAVFLNFCWILVFCKCTVVLLHPSRIIHTGSAKMGAPLLRAAVSVPGRDAPRNFFSGALVAWWWSVDECWLDKAQSVLFQLPSSYLVPLTITIIIIITFVPLKSS